MSAQLSADGKYRYTLYREWDEGRTMLFCMLNPSTADARKDDATIRRCRSFAKGLGYGSLSVINLYAYRATKPAELWKVRDPIGPRNNNVMLRMATKAKNVVCAWGGNAKQERIQGAMKLFAKAGARTWCLGITKFGAPRHPLYLPTGALLRFWS